MKSTYTIVCGDQLLAKDVNEDTTRKVLNNVGPTRCTVYGGPYRDDPEEDLDGYQWLMDNPHPRFLMEAGDLTCLGHLYRFEGKYEKVCPDENNALGDEANSYYDERAATVEKKIDGNWCPADAFLGRGWLLPDGTFQPFED